MSLDEENSRLGTGTPITRRDLLAKLPAAAVAAAAVGAVGAAAVASGCSSSTKTDTGVSVLEVAEKSVVTLESFTEIEEAEGIECSVDTVIELDAGTMLFSSDGEVAAMLCTGKTASPLSTVSLLDLESGTVQEALTEAVGNDEGFSLFDARASKKLLLWVESNYLTGDWRVYSANVTLARTYSQDMWTEDGVFTEGGELLSVTMDVGEGVLLDEGNDSEYDVPEIAVVKNTAYWIVQPAEDGTHATEDSLLKTNGGVAYTSHGRFCGGLTVSGKTVTCMPRAEASGVYYQLTAIQNGTVVAKQVLPRSFKPSTAIYFGGEFSFGIGAAYDYGDGISSVGTYYPMGDGTWLRLTKTPVTAAGMVDGWLFCKSNSRTVFVDLDGRRYFTINAPSGTEDYGDYPVQVGKVDSVVVYATVTKTEEGERSRSVQVRRITMGAPEPEESEDGDDTDGAEDDAANSDDTEDTSDDA